MIVSNNWMNPKNFGAMVGEGWADGLRGTLRSRRQIFIANHLNVAPPRSAA